MPTEPPGEGDRPTEPGAPGGATVEPVEAGAVEVEALHRAIAREPPEPEEGREPPPWWLWVAVATALFWGGFYLGRHGGTFDTRPHVGYLPQQEVGGGPPTSAAPGAPTAPAPLTGPEIYTQRCASCHQAAGEGLAGVFPPIVGSEWVSGDPGVIVRIVLDGLSGPVTVRGQAYDGVMPPWRDQLDDAAIAAVVNHERSLAGAGAEPIEAAFVAEVRAATAGRTTPWTAAELGAP